MYKLEISEKALLSQRFAVFMFSSLFFSPSFAVFLYISVLKKILVLN